MSKDFVKGPGDRLDYGIDWSAWLGSDTITASAWSAPEGITLESDSHTTTATTVWVSGGTAGQSHTLTNAIETAGGREAQRSLNIRVMDL